MADNSVGTATLQDNTVTVPKLYPNMRNTIALVLEINPATAEILYLYNPYGFNCTFSRPYTGAHILTLDNLSEIKNQWDTNAYRHLHAMITPEGSGITLFAVSTNWDASKLEFWTYDILTSKTANCLKVYITIVRPMGNTYP